MRVAGGACCATGVRQPDMRPCRKAAFAVLAVTTGLAIVPGFAASLGGLAAKRLAAGSSVVAACDTDGFTVGYTTSAGSVTAVNLSDIADPGCEGGKLSLALVNTGGAVVVAGGPQTVPTDGDTLPNSMVVSVTPTAAASVTAIHVVVTGP